MKSILAARITWISVFAIVLYILLSPKWLVPFAAWIAPAGIIIVSDSLKPVRSFLVSTLILLLSGSVAMFHVLPVPPILFIPLLIQISLFAAIPFLLNRVVSRQIKRWEATLVFPCIVTVWEYATSFMGGGTWGSLAYTQMNNLALVQVASITGMWGVTFLLAWCSSIVAWSYQQQWNWKRIGKLSIAFLSVITLVSAYGWIRINPYFQKPATTVRVAGITGFQLEPVLTMYRDAFGKDLKVDLNTLTQTSPEVEEINKALLMFIRNPFAPEFRNTLTAFDEFQESMLQLAAHEGDAGAKIISFSEALMFTVKPIEDALIHKGRILAREKNVNLLLCVGSFLSGEIKPGAKYIENKAILIDSTGRVAYTFFKNKPVPIVEGSIPGDGVVPVFATHVGRLAASICYDADFPQLMRQAGVKNTDILLLPAGDWKEISPYHSDMARMRAIENGFSMLRPASGATTIACDPFGRVLGSNGFYGEGEKVLVTHVPVNGVTTLYSRAGDYFIWLCVSALIFMITHNIYTRRQKAVAESRRTYSFLTSLGEIQSHH
jgi:apolipoprotein N-acyltransferase